MNSLWLRVGAPLTFTVNCAMAMGTHLAKLISFIIANVSDVNSPPHSSGKHFPVPYTVTFLCTCFFLTQSIFYSNFFPLMKFDGSFICFSAKTVACFSCMSPLYASKLTTVDGIETDLWESGSNAYFKKPENFTRYCDPDYFDPRKLRLKPCLDTCVWMSTDNSFFGR